MHNKRIGRDDLLKIEVRIASDFQKTTLTHASGPALPPQPPGDLTPDAILLHAVSAATVVLDVNVPLAVAASPQAAVAATTPPVVRMTDVTATTTDVIVIAAGPQIGNVTSRTTVIVRKTVKQAQTARNARRVRPQSSKSPNQWHSTELQQQHHPSNPLLPPRTMNSIRPNRFTAMFDGELGLWQPGILL
jgi:hypothetical protein